MLRKGIVWGVALLGLIGCGKSSSLDYTNPVADEVKDANLSPYADEVTSNYPAPSPASKPGSSLFDQLKNLTQTLKGSGSGGKGSKLLSAFCQTQSMGATASSQTSYSQMRGLKKFGGLMKRFQQRIGSLLQTYQKGGGSGGSSSGYPRLPMTSGGLKTKLQQYCTNPSSFSGMAQLGMGTMSNLSSGQLDDAFNDLSLGSDMLTDQLF